MGTDRFPTMKGRNLHRLLRKLCGDPVSTSGSHRKYRVPGRTGETFVCSYHDTKELNGGAVRNVLVSDVGMTVEEARKAVAR